MPSDSAGRAGVGAGVRGTSASRGGAALAATLVLLLLANAVYLALAVEPGAFHLWNLLLHPLLGLAAGVPLAIAWWRRRSDRPLFWGGALLAASAGAGVALAIVGHRAATRPLLWTHLALGLAGLLVLGAALLARRGRRAAGALATAGALAVAGAVAVGTSGPRPPAPPPAAVAAAADPAGEAMGGAAGPFFPAAAHTTTGAPLAATEVPPPSACAGSGCHDDAVAEWRSSPHALSGAGDPWYLAARDAAGAEAGEAAVTWCAACHEPARLATAAAPVAAHAAAAPPGALAADGVSCAVCHRMVGSRNAGGQGGWVLSPAPLADFAAAESGWRRAAHALAIRLDPEPHRRSFAPAALAAAESCAACHKGRHDAPVNGWRPFSEINDYDAWQASNVSGHGGRSFRRIDEARSCADCHLPPRPEGGRSHRFAAANRALARVGGDAGQVAAVDAALAEAGIGLDLFALVGDDGEATPLAAGAALVPGGSARLDVLVSSRAAGHQLPAGKTDAVDVWVELVGTDAAGRTVFVSGRGGGGDAHRYGRRVLDGEGRLLVHRDLWNARTTVYDRTLQPFAADLVRYRLEVPPDLAGPVTLTARLHYRPISAAFHDWVRQRAGDAVPDEVPAVVLAETSAVLPVAAAPAPAMPGLALAAGGAPAEPVPAAGEGAVAPAAGPDREAWYDYGIGLLLQGDLRGARAAFGRVTEIDPAFADGWLNLGRTALAEGDLAGAEAALARAEELAPDLAHTLYQLGRLAQLSGDDATAAERFARAAEQFPRDRLIRLALAQVHQAAGEHEAAVAELRAVLEVDPEWSVAHFALANAHRALGDEAAAERHTALFERFRADDSAQELAAPYLESHPHDNRERQPIHEHPTTPGAAAAGAAGEAAP